VIVFVAVLPWIRYYARNLDGHDKYLLFVGFCMFVLSLVNLFGTIGEIEIKLIFTSIYSYFFIVCFFSGRPENEIWLKRLHLIPAFATIYEIGSYIFTVYGKIDIESRIGANHSASYLAIILPICWVQLQRERGFFRLLNILVVGATLGIVVISASRTAFVILLFVTILMIIAEKPAKRVSIVVASFLILLSLFFLVSEQSEFMSRMFSLRNPITALEVDRIALWKAAILSIKENPIFGGIFRGNVLRLVLKAAPESNYARHIQYQVAGGNYGVHNGYLTVLVNFGVIVAFLYFRFFISWGKAIHHSRQRILVMENRQFLAAGIISLLGYAVANIALHIYIGQQFFIIWAMLQSSMKNSLMVEETH